MRDRTNSAKNSFVKNDWACGTERGDTFLTTECTKSVFMSLASTIENNLRERGNIRAMIDVASLKNDSRTLGWTTDFHDLAIASS